MSEKRQSPITRRPGIGTGTISLLVIFTVLCFSTLALLSLASAASNQRISRRSLVSAHSLSTAQGETAKLLADFDEALLALHQSAPQDDAEFYTQVASSARQLGFSVDEGAHTVTCTIPIDENNVLITQLSIAPPGAAQRYVITQQYTKLVSGWTPDTGGQLWEGT